MKKILQLALIGVCFVLSGCTQPNGYIGDWFGSWHLEEILIDGEPDEEYEADPNITFSFQGKIVSMGFIATAEAFGNWSYAGEVLTLIAGYQDPNDYTLKRLYDPFPKIMQLAAGVDQVEITVTYINGRRMQWQYINQNGQLMTYNFRKYP